MDSEVDVYGLHAALDAERAARGMSWREVARAAGVSPSLLSRMGNAGQRPDVDGFARLVRWLRLPAEQFMTERSTTRSPDDLPELQTQIAALLRARNDLSNEDQQYLVELVQATVKHMKAKRRGT